MLTALSQTMQTLQIHLHFKAGICSKYSDWLENTCFSDAANNIYTLFLKAGFNFITKFNTSENGGWKKAIINTAFWTMCILQNFFFLCTNALAYIRSWGFCQAFLFIRSPQQRDSSISKGEKHGVYSALAHDWHLIEELHKEQLQRKVSILPSSSSSSLYMKTAH